ncbi:hypothetical protein [Chelativorans salis]|uniref:Uncharacterized protein n=1 Tax=Chelativorans salis TaxID=2978478 RepID=A0ABT2LV52_9HYPH|nr:hypothetical protein [Chelativorans sp. EGI FJ00035]MCT7378413.1 hypothetical protein [Chelativorans sp. EGI FJ00035]
MHMRILTASALALLLASPAFADCQEEVSNLEEAVIAAETGAETGETEMPATEHQEQALEEVQTEGETADTAVTGSVEALSEHQREVLREMPDEDRTEASTVLREARDMAAAGDEEGCMDKLTEAKTLLGLEE